MLRCPDQFHGRCDHRRDNVAAEDELDWVDVAAAVVQGSAEATVEDTRVTAVEAACVGDVVAEVEGHVVHEAEDAARRVCEADVVGMERAEVSIGRFSARSPTSTPLTMYRASGRRSPLRFPAPKIETKVSVVEQPGGSSVR